MTPYALSFAGLWLSAGALTAALYADTWREAGAFVGLGPLTFIAKLFVRKEQV